MIGQTLSVSDCDSIATQNPEFEHLAFWLRVGSHNGRWDDKVISQLDKNEWRVFVLMRDPRNQTASFVALEQKNPKKLVPQLEFFEEKILPRGFTPRQRS